MVEQDPELVPTKPPDKIALPHPPDQQSGDMDQRGVARRMPETVVEHLQPV